MEKNGFTVKDFPLAMFLNNYYSCLLTCLLTYYMLKLSCIWR